jgi:hypothetical protein
MSKAKKQDAAKQEPTVSNTADAPVSDVAVDEVTNYEDPLDAAIAAAAQRGAVTVNGEEVIPDATAPATDTAGKDEKKKASKKSENSEKRLRMKRKKPNRKLNLRKM